LLDVTPLSLGIETMGGVATKVIERNTTIPTSKSQTFSTASDNQTSVDIHIVQGEREMVIDNKSLGRFILDGIPPAPRGMPQIEVAFDIDANGILSVKATDKASGREQSVRIEAKTSLSKEDIEKMKKEAELHAEEDKIKRELVDVKNLADQLVYTAEKALREGGDKVSAETKQAVTDKISAVKTAKEGTDKTIIESANQELSTAMQKIGEEMMNQSKTNQPEAGTQTNSEAESNDSSKKETGGEGDNIKDAETK